MTIEQALAEHRYETARRLCAAAIAGTSTHSSAYAGLAMQMHRALQGLGDIAGCREILHTLHPDSEGLRLEVALLLAEDAQQLGDYNFYRISEAAKAGLTYDEYQGELQGQITRHLEEAGRLAKTVGEQRRLTETAARVGRAVGPAPAKVEEATPTASEPVATGTVECRLHFPDGEPARGVAVTLGLEIKRTEEDPRTYCKPNMHYYPILGPADVLMATTDERGDCQFTKVPAGCHEYIAVSLPAADFDIATRFLSHRVAVVGGETTRLNLTIQEWKSGVSQAVKSPFAQEVRWGQTTARLVATQAMNNPFYFDFPRQMVALDLPSGVGAKADRLVLLCSENPGYGQPLQVVAGKAHFFADLPACSQRVWALYQMEEPLSNAPARLEPQPKRGDERRASGAAAWPRTGKFGAGEQESARKTVPWVAVRVDGSGEAAVLAEQSFGGAEVATGCGTGGYPLTLIADSSGSTAVIETGRSAFRIPMGSGKDHLPPLLAVRGEDGVWRGQGRLILPGGVEVIERSTEIVEAGPLLLQVRIGYTFSDGHEYTMVWTAHAGEAYLLAEETAEEIAGAAFEFSLKEFSGGRGFLHWTPEHGNLHWTDLKGENRELARLQESVAWWIYPQGFGYAMTAKGLEQQDYIGVFSRCRGDWEDCRFERIAQGPGDENRELDWPFPEMVGSTISMITAHTSVDGDAFYRWRFFEGRRCWGILVSTLRRNDGDWKEISAVQHKTSAPRLTDFMHWRLDEQDQVMRPAVVARRAELKHLREKTRVPAFADIWKRICSGKAFGAAEGLRFAVEGNPQVAWRKKLELVGVAHIRARMTLLGRDYSDMYSPVGARPITAWVEDYDLIVASGVFTPEEERLVRSWLMLMGHLYMSPDLMNWKFNSRNANFEADRVDVVGVIGLAFQGNPDAAAFVKHAADRMEKSLNVYCTPGSGKWYENPACYYLHAAKCRMNLAFHLATHGIQDPTAIPRLKDFLRWGILLLTPPCPHDYHAMSEGLGTTTYEKAEKVRRIAPIGDHAHLGPWVPDHYALLAKLYRRSDPEFADLLMWAWRAGGSNGSYYGNMPLLFANLTEEDLKFSPPPNLTSRRLEGFGAAFRGKFNEPDEFFLLFKQGPGGYRYHRTEGSIILFADGKPLIYDGGEAGETWRHSTVSFGATHTPLAPGHVERFHSFTAVDFAQGVHPKALEPGEPIFLSDSCEDQLVQVAYERFAEANPADVRSVLWVKDEYVVLHDDFSLPANLLCHWHLQVVSDGHRGDWRSGFEFQGRFGTNLQVLLPGQKFACEKVEQVPILEPDPQRHAPEQRFSMRHLMLSGEKATQYLAILRPMAIGAVGVQAELIHADQEVVGVEVRGQDMEDQILLGRREFSAGG
ncbi:MAG: hypothetical protein HKL95_06995, partial [Phycisphaerae bacterium]|nr:hypothetical protein [Phycisphaerae bacterium]